MYYNTILFLSILCVHLTLILSFQQIESLQARNRLPQRLGGDSHLHMTDSLNNQMTLPKEQDAMLSFQASINYRTKPAPLPPSEKSMDDFFASKRHRDALLVGTGNIKVERFDSSSSKISKRALAKRWKQEARASGGISTTKGIGHCDSTQTRNVVLGFHDLCIGSPWCQIIAPKQKC